jgi:hypothetical protein
MNSRDFRVAYLETVYNTQTLRFTLSSTDFGITVFDGRRFCLITAANPFSQELTVAQNGERNLELERQIKDLGYEFSWSYGEQSDQSWREDGFVIFDLTLETAMLLARRFDQNAILFGEQSRVALVWCDNEELEWFFVRQEID